MVPRHCSFEYLAFESGAEVHGLERPLGLLESVDFLSLGIMPRCRPSVMCEEHADRKLDHNIYFTAFCYHLHIPFNLLPACGIWLVFLVVVLVIAIAISSVATISRSIASVV